MSTQVDRTQHYTIYIDVNPGERFKYATNFPTLMKRNLVQHGASTLMVSLPAEWAKKHGLRKGDQVEIEPHDDQKNSLKSNPLNSQENAN